MVKKLFIKYLSSFNKISLTLNYSYTFCRNPLAQLEEEKREHDNKMKKMEIDMEQVFEMKVREKKQKLKDSEADVSIHRLCIRAHLRKNLF